MSIFSNPPLIEVIFDLRWGIFITDESDKKVGIQFTQEESQLFFGQFKSAAESEGFAHAERINSKIINPLPHVVTYRFVTYRFRKSPDTWPCYQIGLGIFTVNQLAEGYDWKSFKNICISGLKLLGNGHPLGLDGISEQKTGTQLQYQNAFTFSKDEKSTEFLKTKLNIVFEHPECFIKNDIFSSGIKEIRFSCNMDVKKPKGILNITAQECLIDNETGMILNNTVRSSDADAPDLKEIGTWLDDAHIVQNFAFQNIINPNYLENLKK